MTPPKTTLPLRNKAYLICKT